MNDLGVRATRIDDALRRARRAAEQWEADVHHGRLARDAPPPAEATLAPQVEAEAHALAVALCDAFLDAAPAGRSALREQVAALADVVRLLHAFPGYAAKQLAQTGDERWLQRGLAAVELEGRVVDPRDTQLALEELRRVAQSLR